MQLTEKPEQFRVLHLEDDRTSQMTMDCLIDTNFKNTRVKQLEDSLQYYSFAPFENPDLIICDWTLRDGDVSYLLEELSRFKGLVIFFSALPKGKIWKMISDNLGFLPNNFSVYQKGETSSFQDIIKEIRNYALSIDKDINIHFKSITD